MRILMVQETFLPLVGGAELHVLRLAQALQARGHEVRVVTASLGPREWEGVPVVRLPFLAGRGRRSVATVPLGYLFLLPQILWASAVHGHYSARMSAMAGRLARLLGRPFVLTLHGYGTLDSSVRDDRRMQRDRRTSMRLARRIIGTSVEMCQVASRFTDSSRVVFVPSGVDCARFMSTGQTSSCTLAIATVRRLVPKNGVQFVLEALPGIQRRVGQTVDLVIVGDGRLRPGLETRSRELGVVDSVNFAGTIDNAELPSILAGVAVVVFASSAEATSLAALEAMAAGRPLVATPVGSYPALIGNDERGILVDLFDTRDSNYAPPEKLNADKIELLSDAVSTLLLDPVRARRMGEESADWVSSRYDWSLIAARVESLYVSCADA